MVAIASAWRLRSVASSIWAIVFAISLKCLRVIVLVSWVGHFHFRSKVE
jgi:hypothetical protein